MQVYLLQQQLEQRDRAVRGLQQRLSGCEAGVNSTRMTRSLTAQNDGTDTNNAATQTERMGRLAASLTRPPSVDDGLGPTVRLVDLYLALFSLLLCRLLLGIGARRSVLMCVSQ